MSNEKKGTVGGLITGIVAGAKVGAGLGIAAGPLGAISGLIPGGIIGGIIGGLTGNKIGNIIDDSNKNTPKKESKSKKFETRESIKSNFQHNKYFTQSERRALNNYVLNNSVENSIYEITIKNQKENTKERNYTDINDIFNQGFLFLNSGNIKFIEEDYLKCIKTIPNYLIIKNFNFKAKENGDYYKAIENFDKIIAKEKNYYAYYLRAIAKNAVKDYDGAIYDGLIAHEGLSSDTNINNIIGLSYYNNKNYEQALIFFDEAIKIDSKNLKTYFNRGLVYYQIKEFKKSLLDFEKCIEINKYDFEAIENIKKIQKLIK